MEGRLKEIFDGGTVDSLKKLLMDANVVIPKGAKKEDLAGLVLKLENGEELERVGDAEKNAELPYQELADQLFKQYEQVNEFFITKDGQAFAEETRAAGHGTGYDTYKRG